MRIRVISSVILLFVLGAGCKKNVDLKPTDTVTEDVAYNNVAALQKGLNTAYANYAGARVDKSWVSSLTSDETRFGPDNGGTGQFAYRLQYGSDGSTGGDVTNGFFLYYRVIDRVNRVLERLPLVAANSAAEASQKTAINGQLLALRALSHFELLEAYSKKYDPTDPLGVIVMTQTCLTCYPARNTVADVVARVEQDLADAKLLVPAVSGAYNDLVLNPISITAIQARVALYKGEWQKASDYATTVISSGAKTLATGVGFTNIWTDGNTNELLFRSRFENSAALGANWTNTNGNVIFSPSDKLTNAYATTDVRLNAFIGTTSGKRYLKKFYSSSRGGGIVDLKGIRIAEMYLIRAEARAELNDLAGASADINTLRTARIAGYTPITYADKGTAVADIIQERFKELCFEGFRFFDLKRKGLPLQRSASDVDSPVWQNLAAGDKRFVYPIPADEILANPNMKQNQGY